MTNIYFTRYSCKEAIKLAGLQIHLETLVHFLCRKIGKPRMGKSCCGSTGRKFRSAFSSHANVTVRYPVEGRKCSRGLRFIDFTQTSAIRCGGPPTRLISSFLPRCLPMEVRRSRNILENTGKKVASTLWSINTLLDSFTKIFYPACNVIGFWRNGNECLWLS